MLKSFLKKTITRVLTWEASMILRKYKPRIIAVTGSVGKTSAKDAIYSVLAPRDFVRKSEKSFNSELGVPLSIIGRPNAWNNPLGWLHTIGSGLGLIVFSARYPQTLVLEVGADRPGDIRDICAWLKPDVAVVTRFAPVPVHVEFFGTSEAVYKEKSELVRALKSEGALVLSHDDPDVLKLAELAPRAKLVTFGFSKGSDVLGAKGVPVYDGRGDKRRPIASRFSIRFGHETETITIPNTVGRQSAYAALAAAAVGVALGLRLDAVAPALSGTDGPPGRMKLIEGINNSLIIDDTYNSSPVALREALDTFLTLAVRGRKIAVLGDMLELGRFSVEEHRAAGAHAAERVDMLVTVGFRMRDAVAGALATGMKGESIMQFDDSRAAGDALRALVKPGDVILVKGSQGSRMEKAVEALMAHPEEKEKLLVRQEQEWKRR